MKRLFAVLYIAFVNISTACASVSVPSSMKQAMKGENSDMPSILNLVLSMAIVIALIYFTGWVYQKLNKINRKKLTESDLLDKNNFKVVASMPLGQQKNLYAVEINGKVLVLGATAQNISLIKEFDNSENVELKTIFEETEQNDEKADGLEAIYKKYKN